DALRDVPCDLGRMPYERLPGTSGDFDAAREGAGIHPVFQRITIVDETEGFQLGVAQVSPAEVSAAQKASDQLVIRIAFGLHHRFYGTLRDREPSAFNVLFRSHSEILASADAMQQSRGGLHDQGIGAQFAGLKLAPNVAIAAVETFLIRQRVAGHHPGLAPARGLRGLAGLALVDSERQVDGAPLGEVPRGLQCDRRLRNHDVGVVAIITRRPPAPACDARCWCLSHRDRLLSHPSSAARSTASASTTAPSTSSMSSAWVIAAPIARRAR